MLKYARIVNNRTGKVFYVDMGAVCAVYENGPYETHIELVNNTEPMVVESPLEHVLEALERTMNENYLHTCTVIVEEAKVLYQKGQEPQCR